MTLAGSTGTNTPLLVNRVSFFVEPEGGVIEIRGRFRREAAFLFFDEEFFENRVDAGCGVSDIGGTAGWGNRHEITVAHTVFSYIFAQLLPTFGCITAALEVSTGFPFGTFESRVGTFFFSQFHGCFNCVVGNVFK